MIVILLLEMSMNYLFKTTEQKTTLSDVASGSEIIPRSN